MNLDVQTYIHAIDLDVTRKSKASTKKLPPRTTRYAPVAGPFGLFRGDTVW